MFNSGEPKFFVNSEDNNFCNRQKNIFAQLDAAVESNEPLVNPKQGNECLVQSETPPYNTHFSNPNKRQKLETKQFRGQESIFKRPEAPPPPRIKRDIPDHKRNPHKWTKYSLSDVSSEDMSDKSNTAAAMSFLQELKSHKTSVEPMDVECKSHILFKRPSNENVCKNEPKIIKTTSNDFPLQDEGPCFRSSKLVMPEYVVGQKKLSKKFSRKICKSCGKDNVKREIKLDHLAEEDEDENVSE